MFEEFQNTFAKMESYFTHKTKNKKQKNMLLHAYI